MSPGTIMDKLNKSMDRLEQLLHNMSFEEVTKDQWEKAVSPSSSLSSIESDDEENLLSSPKKAAAINDSKRQSLNTSTEESVSLDEINAQIGIAEELTPKRHLDRRAPATPTLETITEDQILHTPPKPHTRSRFFQIFQRRKPQIPDHLRET